MADPNFQRLPPDKYPRSYTPDYRQQLEGLGTPSIVKTDSPLEAGERSVAMEKKMRDQKAKRAQVIQNIRKKK